MTIVKLTWQDKVEKVASLHKEKLKEYGKAWTVDKTAKITGYSHGRICEYLQLDSWMKTHPRVAEFTTVKDALEYIKEKRFQQKVS